MALPAKNVIALENVDVFSVSGIGSRLSQGAFCSLPEFRLFSEGKGKCATLLRMSNIEPVVTTGPSAFAMVSLTGCPRKPL